MKDKTVFICQGCGARSPKWLGRCSACGEWNTLVEEIEEEPPEPADDEEAAEEGTKRTRRAPVKGKTAKKKVPVKHKVTKKAKPRKGR